MIVGEDVCNRRQTVVGLCCRDVVNVARLAQTAGTVLRMAGVRVAWSEAGERLVERS
jgi:hypothetical protein